MNMKTPCTIIITFKCVRSSLPSFALIFLAIFGHSVHFYFSAALMPTGFRFALFFLRSAFNCSRKALPVASSTSCLLLLAVTPDTPLDDFKLGLPRLIKLLPKAAKLSSSLEASNFKKLSSYYGYTADIRSLMI